MAAEGDRYIFISSRTASDLVFQSYFNHTLPSALSSSGVGSPLGYILAVIHRGQGHNKTG